MLKILSWNVDSATTKKAALTAFCKTEKYDIIILQETLLRVGKSFKINGYNTYMTHSEGSDRGLAILVKSVIPVNRVPNPIACRPKVEVLAVTLTLLNGELDIYNIYRKIHREHTGELDVTQLFAHASARHTLICGDFNAHHGVFSSPAGNNESGEHLASALGDFPDMCLLNNGQPTHVRGGRLDLSFISLPIRHLATWNVHPTLTSDHFAVSQLQTPHVSHQCLHPLLNGIKT